MEIKFNKSLSDYKYLIMFDLASRITGVCIWDIQNNIPIKTKVLKVDKDHELGAAALYDQIDTFFNSLRLEGINLNEVLVYKEAMPVQLRGGSSTVQTFIALAKSHAILDYYTYSHNIAVYDYVGVYPISTHAYLKHLMDWDNKHKVEKKDIQEYIKFIYNLDNVSFDESDAIFLAKTFVDIKWNKDLDEQIRAIKKHSKTLKAEHSILACQNEINRLQGLKKA